MSIWNLLYELLTGESLESTRIPSSEIFTYRTEDGVAYFKFSYHWVNSGYEIDIHQWPSYENRSSTSHMAHWLNSPRQAKRKICIKKNYMPKTLDGAQKFSIAWAELTWTYIKTGVSIDAQIATQHRKK